MKRVAVLTALFSCVASGQFYHLATTEDGSIVYFSTRHRRAGTDEPFQGRIYAVDAQGVKLFAERENTTTMERGLFLSTFYDMSAVDVSGDGSTVAFAGRRECSGGSPCVTMGDLETTLRARESGAERRIPGQARLSANGRYAVTGAVYAVSGLVDLQTGETYPRNRMVFQGPGRVVADDGTTVGPFAGVLVVSLDGAERRVGSGVLPTGAAIDPAATTVAYTETDPEDDSIGRLRMVDLADGSVRTLVEGVGEALDPVLTSDASRVLFRTTVCLTDTCTPGLWHAFIIQTDGTGLRRISPDETGVRRATLSGDGIIAYLVTGMGELIKLELESGKASTLIPRTPTIESPTEGQFGILSVGSLSYLFGAGFVRSERAAESFPLPTELAGFRMKFAGLDAPLFSVRPDVVAFQTPWELKGRRDAPVVVPIQIETDAASGFELEPILAYIFLEAPAALSLPDQAFTLAASGDFSTILTADNPAAPGDIIHAYATGLGAVAKEPATGHPAPSSGLLARLRQPLACAASVGEPQAPQQVEVPVLYAGLAPGLVGVYQVSLSLPADLRPAARQPDRTAIRCVGALPGGFIITLPVRF